VPDFARWLKILSEPNRLKIINLLMEGVQCNCEIGEALGMAPNLISHHLKILRQAGLVDVERDPLDNRWLYYTINKTQLDALSKVFAAFFDPGRIQPRKPTCGPQSALIRPELIELDEH
jgi:ArsR family transcriptional regulator